MVTLLKVVDTWTSWIARAVAIGGFLVLSYSTVTPAVQEWLAGVVLNTEAFSATVSARLAPLQDLGDLQTDSFRWVQGGGATRMIPVTEGICYLTGVTGSFAGGGESVRVRALNGLWILDGRSQALDVGATAHCWRFPILAPAP